MRLTTSVSSSTALLVCVLQELVGIMAGSKGLVLMAPPAGNAEAQKTLAGMLSSIKPKTKVRLVGLVTVPIPWSNIDH
jgi:hypothetical protein